MASVIILIDLRAKHEIDAKIGVRGNQDVNIFIMECLKIVIEIYTSA